jgi:SAM-dependent methyltransferase
LPRTLSDLRELRRFKQRIEALSNGKQALANSAPAMALARLLNRSMGSLASRAVSYGLRNRSAKLFIQVEPFITRRSSVLDLGCGDGRVGALIAERKESNVVLTDIVDYNKTNLPFIPYDGRNLDAQSRSFDHVLLLTVLHHSDDPVQVMREALRVADKSVIVIESVYFNILHRQLNKLFDWFYNRALNNPEINVPFNFLTPNAWPVLFEELGGRVTHMKHLGIDEPIVPEWHTLYVVRK